MAQFTIKDLDPEIFAKLSNRAASEGWTLRAVFAQLARDYGDGKIQLSRAAPAAPAVTKPTLREIAWSSMNDEQRQPFQWQVLGLPHGRQAMIAQTGPRLTFQVLRIGAPMPDGTGTAWRGAFASSEDALAFLIEDADWG